MSDTDKLSFRLARGGVSAVLIGEVLKILVEKGVGTEGEAIARLERVSAECMASPTGATAGKAVGIIQIVRDMVAGDIIGAMPTQSFPPPWSVDEGAGSFIAKGAIAIPVKMAIADIH